MHKIKLNVCYENNRPTIKAEIKDPDSSLADLLDAWQVLANDPSCEKKVCRN